MRIVTRYLLAEMVTPALAALLAFVVLIVGHVLFTVVDAVAGKGVRIESIAQFAVLKAPAAVGLALPVAVLLGCALGLNRLASENELIPLIGAGVSGRRLLLAPLIVGGVAGLVALSVREFAVPAADRRAEQLLREMAMRQKAMVFRAGRLLDTGDRWVFLPGSVSLDSQRLEPLTVLMRRGSSLPMVLRARSAVLGDDAVRAESVDVFDVGHSGTLSEAWSPEVVIGLRTVPDGFSIGDPVGHRSIGSLLRERAKTAGGGPGRREYDLEIHGELSLAGACMVLPLLAVPIALRFGRGQSLAGVLAALVVAFLYYIIMLAMRLLGGNGVLPAPVAAWSQNVVWTVVSLVAMRRL